MESEKKHKCPNICRNSNHTIEIENDKQQTRWMYTNTVDQLQIKGIRPIIQ